MLLGALTIGALLRQLRRVRSRRAGAAKASNATRSPWKDANEGHWDWDLTTGTLFLSPQMKCFTVRARMPGSIRALNGSREWRFIPTTWRASRSPSMTTWRGALAAMNANIVCATRTVFGIGYPREAAVCATRRASPSRFVGSSSDVTAEKQSQVDKEQLEAQLRQSQKMEAIGTLAGGIAHDFNNILGAILGYGELAHQQSPEGSPIRRYLDSVMHAAERAQMLVERILGFSRSGLGDRVPVNVQFVVEETLELLERIAARRHTPGQPDRCGQCGGNRRCDISASRSR